MKPAENKRKYIYSCVVLTIVLLLVLSAGAILAKYVVNSNVAKINLTIEAGGFKLIDGPSFNNTFRTLTKDNKTSIIFGYYDDYNKTPKEPPKENNTDNSELLNKLMEGITIIDSSYSIEKDGLPWDD